MAVERRLLLFRRAEWVVRFIQREMENVKARNQDIW